MSHVIKCLIIDDDEDDQEVFLMCISKIDRDIECRTANNCIEAMAMLNEDAGYTPNYIFLDVNMPKMNGMECLKELTKIERLAATRIFMYSTTSEQRLIEESKALGAYGFLVKPARASELKEKLRDVFAAFTNTNNGES